MPEIENPRYLSEEYVRRWLDPARLVEAITTAFRERYSQVLFPPRTTARLKGGVFLAMSCCDPGGHALGIKLVMVRDAAYEGVQLRQGRIQATYLLLDPETAEPRLTIAANYLTDLRTAATSAVATKFLARPDASTLGIFGTGRLARTHLAVLALVRDFRRVLVCGRDADRTAQFIRELSSSGLGRPGPLVEPADAHTCAAESDVICTCTSSSDPLFDGRDLRAGTHLNLVGSFQPHAREVDTNTIQRSRVVVDSYDAGLSEPGDLLIPLEEGAITLDHVVADLHEVVNGRNQGRGSPDDITVFKSVGCALEDLVAAELLLSAPG